MATQLFRRSATAVGIALLTGLIAPDSIHGQRLPSAVVPEHYRLAFSPDLEREEFRGEARIRVKATAPTSRCVLHAADLRIISAAVDVNGVTEPATVTSDPAAQTMTVRTDRAIGPGLAELHLVYEGRLNRELRGFYISEANSRKYAVTQLEATDARRMFPAFDEPGFKATFDIQATVAAHDRAISNGAIESVTPGPAPGTHTFDFATTKPMSTYLVALAVGDFECVERSVEGTPLGICATPGNKALTAFALDAARASVEYLNQYFGIDYPFQKLDLVAIPDFAAGAMENTGAAFFRESLLLIAPDASLNARKRAATVIAHEIAHMWFGNLVTMQWWDDLWLNEGFATWMESKVVAAWKPEWDLELDELVATHSVMTEDARQSTRAVRTAADTPAEIEALFDPIAYEKAAAVLGMVESFVGESIWRSAVNAYIDRHQFGNATAEDFWRTATSVTKQPVDHIMRSFVDRTGLPLVNVETACSGGEMRVTLSQTQFPRGGPTTSNPWVIPVCLQTRGDAGADVCRLLDQPLTTVTLPDCARWVVGNRGADGYYRTRHGPDALERLIKANAELAADERLMLIADQWALVRTHTTTLEPFFKVARALAADAREPAVLSALGARLQFVHEYLTTKHTRTAYEQWVRQQFGLALRANRATLPATETQRARRAALLGIVGAVGRDAAVLADARRRVQSYLGSRAAERIPGELLDAYVGLAALNGDRALYDQYQAHAQQARTPEERYRFLYALAAFRDETLVRRTIEYAMSPSVRAQDRALLLMRVLANPAARPIAWHAIQQQWDQLQAGLGAFGGTTRIIQGLAAFCGQRPAEDIRAFFNRHPVPGSQRALAQTLEDIESCAVVADSQRPTLLRAIGEAQ